MPFLPNLRGGAGVAALLLLQLATPCWCDWVYSPNSYFHLQVDTCQTRAFEDGPCGACPLGTAEACAQLDANAYAVPTSYSVVTTEMDESCLRTAAGATAGIAESECTAVQIFGADNDQDKVDCEAAGNPSTVDNYCAYTYAGPVDSDRTLKDVRLVKSENFTVSWHIVGGAFAASGSSLATRRAFMVITQTECPETLIGRTSFLQDLCEGHAEQSGCTAAGAPCSWNDAKSECEVVVQSVQECTGTADNAGLYPDCGTAYLSSGRTTCPAGCTLVPIPSYTGTVTFTAPSGVGSYTLDLYDEVTCPETETRPCAEVVEEKPDIIKFSATLVGDATEDMIRTAIAQVAQEETTEVYNLVVGPGAAGEAFSIDADVRMTGSSNTTEHELIALDFEKNNFASTLSIISGVMFHPDQTQTTAFTAKGDAPCWARKHRINLEIEAAECNTGIPTSQGGPCPHGDCVLTDTCVCETGWGHSATALDCNRPICPAVFEAGCSFGCCNGGNCTAPATCTCPQGWGGQDCRDYVCEPHWDAAKMILFRDAGGEGSLSWCENGGVCIGYNQCRCSSAWTGAGCQTNVNECIETQLQTPTCSSDSICTDTPGYYNCTCVPHFVGDGAYCYPERNATIKVFAPTTSGYVLRQRVISDVTTALGTPSDSITVNSVDESSAAAWLELRILMVVGRPPALLCQELLGLLVNTSEAAGGDGAAAVLVPVSEGGFGLAFDVGYGVEVSEWGGEPPPPPPQTFALEITLTATWDPALELEGSPERVAFESNFKESVATECSIDESRVNITGLSAGSIVVAFELLPDPSDPDGGGGGGVVAAVTALESTMASCIDGPVICPSFAGYEPAAYSQVETTPPAPVVVDEEALLAAGRPEIRCYSGLSGPGCEAVSCDNDAQCAALEGIVHDGAYAYCSANDPQNRFCEDGLVPKDTSAAYRPGPGRPTAAALGAGAAAAAAAVFWL